MRRITGVLDELIPNKKTKTVLEEAEWEDDNADGTFGKELIMQCGLFWFGNIHCKT